MAFEELWAKIRRFKITGELDKIIMAKLEVLLPVKQLAYRFLEDAAAKSPEFESDNKFLNYFNDIFGRLIAGEAAHDGFPDRYTNRIFIPTRKIMMSHVEADRVYYKSLAAGVCLIRAAPRPPLSDQEVEEIEKRYGIKVV